MKSFERPVAVVTDRNSVEDACAIRVALEVFRLRVDFYRMVQRRHLLAFLAGDHIPYDYTILCAHGTGPDDAPKIVVEVVDQVAGDHAAETGWDPVPVELTPNTIPELVHATGGTLVCGACGAGRAPLADAFLVAGYDAYIGAEQAYIDGEAASSLRSVSSTSPWPKSEDRAPCPTATPKPWRVRRRWTRNSDTGPSGTATTPAADTAKASTPSSSPSAHGPSGGSGVRVSPPDVHRFAHGTC